MDYINVFVIKQLKVIINSAASNEAESHEYKMSWGAHLYLVCLFVQNPVNTIILKT